MIVTCLPVAFSAGSSFAITHRPAVDEFYVEANDPNATYQWYELMNGYVPDDDYAVAAEKVL